MGQRRGKYILLVLLVCVYIVAIRNKEAIVEAWEESIWALGQKKIDLPWPEELDESFCQVRYFDDIYEINSYLAEDGKNYFFLPADVDTEKVPLFFVVPDGCKLSVNGEKCRTGYFYCDISEDQKVEVRFTSSEGNVTEAQYHFLQSSVHSLYVNINEELGSIEAMQADKEKETKCYGTCFFSSVDQMQDFSTYLTLKGRGNASWTDEKKGYALTFYNSDVYDDKEGTNICGMGKSSKWTLIANYKDRTQLRNAIALDMAQALGLEGAVEYIFVDLYINGEYQGLYTLTEKVEADDDRIDVVEATEDNLSGSYLLEFDNYEDTPQFFTSSLWQRVTIKDPADLNSYTAIQEFINEADAAICSENGYNEQSGKYWYEYIDIDSFAKLWIVREYTVEYDASVNFKCYYDASDGLLHGGPAWDFDNALGRNVEQYADPTYKLFESGDRNSGGWMTQLMKFSEFTDCIKEIHEEYGNLFDTNNPSSVYALAVNLRDEAAASIEMNYIVWEEMLTHDKWNMPEDTTYDGHFRLLLDFIEQRNIFWSNYIPAL